MSKVILLGYGSIGRRHAANLEKMGHHLVIADPFCPDPPGGLFFRDWDLALDQHADARAVFVCSPTASHAGQIVACWQRGLPVYVEKPVCLPGELGPGDWSHFKFGETKSAVGFQYRFHPVVQRRRGGWRKAGRIRFVARDDLLGRYGPRVGEVMAAHPLDTALYTLGPAMQANLLSDGVGLYGWVMHRHGMSEYDLRMDSGPRVSQVWQGQRCDNLFANDDMYRDAVRAFLDWVMGGPRDRRLALLTDGLAVTELLGQVKEHNHVTHSGNTSAELQGWH